MNVLYTVFGLLLESNLEIPGLAPERISSRSSDVLLKLGETPGSISGLPELDEEIYTSAYKDDSGEPALRIWKTAHGSLLRLDYFDGAQFWLCNNGTAVWARWRAALTIDDVATYLLGPVLGLLLRLRGIPCLHASAVAFGEFAVALAGSEGAGKSTTAAALARRGHPVVSDDIVALAERDGQFFVLPAYPYLSLWPESVKLLYGPEKALPSFSSAYDKRQLLLGENLLKFQERPLPLGAVFVLGNRTTYDEAPFIETLSPRESLLSLVANSYATNLLDADMRGREFELLGRLVQTVPVWRIRPHEEGSRIEVLCELIYQKCAEAEQKP